MEKEELKEEPKEEPQEEEMKVEEPYLGPWKTKEEAEKGITNLQNLLAKQGNELGELRKLVEQQKQQPKEPEKPEKDYDKEIESIQKQIETLDPIEEDYQKKVADLIAKSNRLVAEKASHEALSAAQQEFKKALDERDIQSMHQKFLEENPDFNTPEMQQQIQAYIERDKTGMADALSAYREIQRDQALAELQRIQQENEELRKLLDLKKGEEVTGTVITKGQSPNQPKKKTKVTGEDLRRGMLEAVRQAG